MPDAHPGVPILVCCRHAGPGDSFTLIHTLMAWYSREPRVVLKATIQDVADKDIVAQITGAHPDEQRLDAGGSYDPNKVRPPCPHHHVSYVRPVVASRCDGCPAR